LPIVLLKRVLEGARQQFASDSELFIGIEYAGVI
jgi:hypothetical protein